MRAYLHLLDRPWLLLAFVCIALAAAAPYWPRFEFDASADTLVVDGDPKLLYYLETGLNFRSDEFLVLTYRPGSLFTPQSLALLERMQAELAAIDGVSSVFSILDAPLLQSPPLSLDELAGGDLPTLRDPDVELAAAKNELTTSPVFSELLISLDGETTAIRIVLDPPTELDRLQVRRGQLRGLNALNAEQAAELERLEPDYQAQQLEFRKQRTHVTREVRRVRDAHAHLAELHLGGVPMIAADMIAYVQRDVLVFGSIVSAIVIIMMTLFFGRLIWVVLPIITSGFAIALVVGFLGFIDRPVTVVSSNFVSLMAIITISFTIHLIVRYRELRGMTHEMSHEDLVKATMASKFAPCLYTALTTMVAFGSLMASRIVPVEDFGWMMCLGVLCAFVASYSIFPAALLLLGRRRSTRARDIHMAFTDMLSRAVRHHHLIMLGVAALFAVVAAIGLNRLSLENRFVDYFRDGSEIRDGMIYLDEQLGGTVPFEVITSFPPFVAQEPDPDDDFFFDEPDPFPERYWFTSDKLERLEKLQQFIAEQPAVGNITSVANLAALARQLNDGEPLDSVQLAGVMGELPENIRTELIAPYAAPAIGAMRISARVRETGPRVSRDNLVQSIQQYAENTLGFPEGAVNVTGVLVLFDDSLKQLFASQRDTLVWVVLATLVMFLVLLRSPTLAILGVLPNVLAAALVISFMGYAGIPLNMMTITIAAISIGIGVDDAIHYLHRFRHEFQATGDVVEAIRRSHASIGRAMYYTSVIVMVGFSVLVFSNFVPTIYFGILTALAMALALLANLTVLPSLLIVAYKRRARPSLVDRIQ
jgi:predicted RND superfamily exporter protein